MGYKDKEGIKRNLINILNVEIFENVKNISEYMHKADLIFTSGRTIYEIASIEFHVFVFMSNNRELTIPFHNAKMDL